MVAKKALRLTAAAALAGMTLGAGTVHGATAHATRTAASGVISMTDWEAPDGCGPANNEVVDASVCNPMLSPLFQVNNNLTYYPDLAQSIPTVKNGGAKVVNGNLVVTYKLKPNLKWSDGSPLTTSDLIFGTKLELAVGNSFGIDQITNMKALNSTTLQVTYKGTYAPYYEYGQPIPQPQAYLQKKYGTTNLTAIASKFGNDNYNSPSDVFSGPYKLQSWTNGQSVVLVPNPDYHGLPPASGHPLPAQIKFVIITDNESALATALQSSKAGVDKAEDFQYTDLPVLDASKAYHINVQPSLEYEHLELNTSGPLKDVRVRQALNYAIDKSAYFSALFPAIPQSKVNSYLLSGPVPNVSPWADKSLPVNSYNVSKAKALLKAAGYSTDYNGPGKHLTLRFATTSAPIRQKSFGVLQRYWAAVGIHVVGEFPLASGNGGLFSPYQLNGVLAQRRFDIAEFAYEVPPDPQSLEENFDPSLVPTASKHGSNDLNYMGTDQQQFKLLEQARYQLDSSQRHATLNKWQALEAKDVYWIMLFNRANITATNGTIGNFKPNPSSAGNSWNAFQWYKTGAS